MAGNFGVIGTKYVDLKPTIDEAYLRGLETASGLQLADLVRLTDAGMAALNEELPALLAGLISFTDEPETGERSIGRKYVTRAGEYTIARGQRISETSHMLPIDKYDITTGFTEDGLHDITLSRFNAEMQAIVDGWRMLYAGEALTALFNPASVPVARNSSVLSPRFAGSGTGDYEFTGTYPNGQALPGGYTHYFRTAEADLAATMVTIKARLKRWHQAPYDAVGSADAVEQLSALPGFIAVGETGITPGMGTAIANLDPDLYVGQLPGRVRIRQPLDELGSGAHFALFKTYGDLDERNPLKWRYDPKWGREAFVRGRDDFPLAESTVIQRFGIGVSDRAGAILVEINDSVGSYAAPTITF